MQSYQEPLLWAVRNACNKFATQMRYAAQLLREMSYNTHAITVQDLFNGGDPGRRMQRRQTVSTADGHRASCQQSR